MIDIETLIAMNQQIAAEAAERGLVPFVPSVQEIDRWPPFPIPNLGYLEPDGWDKTDASWFVDKTGCGFSSEPALTVEQFKKELRAYVAENPGDGIAITEEGPFQVVVSAFRQVV